MAEGNNAQEILQDLILCSVCFGEFSNKTPRQLSCLHVVCEECVQSIHDARNNRNSGQRHSVECPVCKCLTVIPGGKASNLPYFFYCTQIERVIKQLEKRHATCAVCETHTHKSPVSYCCVECRHCLCDECHQTHGKLYPDHAEISVAPSTVKDLMCQDHGVHLQYFCMTCYKAICLACHIGRHHNHDVCDLIHDGSDDKVVEDHLSDLLMSSLQLTDEAMSKLNVLQDEVDADWKNSQDDIKEHYEEALKQLNEQFTSACTELKQRQDGFNKVVTKLRDDLEKGRERITYLIQQTTSWRQLVKSIPGFKIANIDDLMLDIENQLPSTDIKVTRPSELILVPGTINFGKLSEQDVFSIDLLKKPTLLRQIKQTGYIYDMEYIDNHLIVLSDYELRMFDEEGQEISHYLSDTCNFEPGDGKLRGMCVNSTGLKVAVVQHREDDRPSYLQLYVKTDTKWQHHRYEVCGQAWSVAFTNQDDFIIGTSNQKLYRYSQNGIEVWCRDLPSAACALFVDKRNRILSCLYDDVCIWNKDGERLGSFKSGETKLDPYDVFVVSNSDVLVCDGKNNAVLVFEKNGDSKGELLSVNWKPNRLALCKNGHLALSEWGSYSVHVYKV